MSKQATSKQIDFVKILVNQAEGLGLNLFEEMDPHVVGAVVGLGGGLRFRRHHD